jgi:PAS domain S-box-containing protein
MSDLAKLTRAQLIERLRKLETAGATDSPAGSTMLHESEERLRAILETAVEGIITIDDHGIVESMNPAAEEIFGYRAAEVKGRNVSVLMPSPHREEHDGYIQNYIRTGHAKIIGIGREVTGRRKDGSVFPMFLAVSEVRLADRRLFTGFIRDVTDRKSLEKEILEISDRERRRVGQDLHDGLGQHLAGIELMSQVLAQKLERTSKSAAASVGEIAAHVREAISQTRSLARGLSPVTLESEGLASALQELATNTEKMFNISCRFASELTGPVRDSAVATHLYRIAQEAVSNAIRHGKAREIVIRLEPFGARNVLTVSDNGAGLPEGFSEARGMGLRIMEYRASMIAGQLSVKNHTGGGVLVVCSVPQEKS